MKLLLSSTLLLAAGFTSLAGASDVTSTSAPLTTITSSDSRLEVDYNGQEGLDAQNPLNMGDMGVGDSPRHRQEKAHLLKRMDRKTGKWDRLHPRHRLLEALYGFSKYRERNMVELEKWRTMYASVGKAQKKVRYARFSFRNLSNTR